MNIPFRLLCPLRFRDFFFTYTLDSTKKSADVLDVFAGINILEEPLLDDSRSHPVNASAIENSEVERDNKNHLLIPSSQDVAPRL